MRDPRVLAQVVCALALVVASVLQTANAFIGDAGGYWISAEIVADGGNPFATEPTGQLSNFIDRHGVLTAFMYAPAALVHRFIGLSPGRSVALENGLLIALVGAVIIPAIVAHYRTVTPRVVLTCAAVTGLVLISFAPYPLSDLPAAVLAITAVVAAIKPTPARLVAAGVLLAAAFGLRPFFLLALIACAAAVVWVARRSALWFALGIAIAALPQLLTNLLRGDGFQLTPPQLSDVALIQGRAAAFTVRFDGQYDGAGRPIRQYFCDPSWAQSLGTNVPKSSWELIATIVQHPIKGTWFVVEKLTASLHWSLATPYYSHSLADEVFALAVVGVVVFGIVAIARELHPRGELHVWMMVALAGGLLITLVLSAPETRFALPVVLLGVVGVTLVVTRSVSRPTVRVLVACTVATLLVVALGHIALEHPAAPGTATAATCTAT